MGTEIQANAFFPKNHHMIDLNENGRNGLMSLHHDNQMSRNGQGGGEPTMTQAYQNGYPANNLEKVRQTILTQESVFRNQLQELHRLYRRQRDLMNEVNMEEIKKSPNVMLASQGDVSANSFSNPHIDPRDFFKNSLDRTDRGLVLGNPELRNGRTWNELRFDGQAERRMGVRCDTRDFCPAKSQMCPESLLPVSRNGPLSSPLESGESMFQKKRRIFGVEIPEGNNASCDDVVRTIETGRAEPFWMRESVTFKQNATPRIENRPMASTVPPSWNSNSFVQNLELLGKNVNGGCAPIRPNSYGGPDHRGAGIDPETPKGGLPWFLRNTQSNGEPSKGSKSPYFMNLDSLQNCSQSFFMRAEGGDGSFLSSKQKKEISVPVNGLNVEGSLTQINKSQSDTKILGFSISNMLHSFKDSDSSNKRIHAGGAEEVVKKDENGPRYQLETKTLDHVSNLRHHIDLNLALDEEDAPLTPCLPTAVVKIATTEIDLEAPVIESEADGSGKEANSSKPVVPRQESEISYEECDRSAADALLYISCFGEKSLMEDEAHELPQAESTDCLKWFADIISSQSEIPVDKNRVFDEEDPFLEGMDLFEFMTLKLEDTKNENYMYNPMILDIDEETAPAATVHKPSRRGQSRRGRQQKDFQRDILPAISTLSRHEMKEDIKAFEEIYKGEGSARNLSKSNSMKKGKGRKRTVGPSTPPQAKPHCSTRSQQEPVSQELRLTEGSLVGWGKKTRRMPRQRCQNLHLLHSLPVKC